MQHNSPPVKSASESHRQWLELVDVEGPFLAIPALKRVWPNGVPDFRSTHPDRFEPLADARKDFEIAWEALDRTPDDNGHLDTYRNSRDMWVEIVLREVIGWAESLQWGSVAGVQAQSPNHAVTVTAQAALVGPDGIGALVHVVDPTDSLRQTPNDLWAATAIDRLEALLRENDVEIGIVTDGRWWGLVCASEGRMAASGIVDALTWVEEPRARDAFLTLTSRQHVIGGDPNERLPILFEESVAAAEEITEALGAQVRRAVELLIQSFSESAADAKRHGQPDPLPDRTHDTYEAAVTVMMRTVFLLFAEERGLLPTGELFEQGYGISHELGRLAARESEEGEDALDATSLTWHRLLATSQALFTGASFENLRMPAYGGSLFDPVRFPFLTATTDHGTLAVAVSDRVMLHVLRSVQVATVRGDARQISFRDIDVEQIGYIYEGLLGYTCATVNETYLGIIGTTGVEPEVPLATLERLADETPNPKKLAAAIREWISDDQPSAKASSAVAIAKAIQAEIDPQATSAVSQVVGDDAELRDRITPWLGLVRRDLRNHPFVVLKGGLVVKETPSRKNSGAHYTPKSLAEDVVLHALQPLCYSPGPHQAADKATWKLKSSDELLDLKVADIACGSGAFLVASARYLADRVVEAWIGEDQTNAQRKDLYTRSIRQVVANCLYGADINDMAVEMCKLSLWLVSLDRDLPFSFVDDKVFLGNSLLGVTSLDQLRKLHIDPKRVPVDRKFDIFEVDIDAIIRKAVDLRERLATEIDEDDPARSSASKRRQLSELRQVTASLRQIADGVVAAGLPLGGKPGQALDESYDSLRAAVKQAHPGPDGSVRSSAGLENRINRGLVPSVMTDYERWRPLHWVLEAPDVVVEHRGFDAVVGNPPFLGGSKISGAMGGGFRDWMVHVLARGQRGSADLVAYFFLRAWDLIAPGGTLGLIATNSIAQGKTREVALDQMVAEGLTITRAIRSQPWPSAAAAVDFAAVWGASTPVGDDASLVANGLEVQSISAHLEGGATVTEPPVRLVENAGTAFEGHKPYGMGFILSHDAAADMVKRERCSEVIRPFLGGDEVNSDPSLAAARSAIDFNDMSLIAAQSFSLPFARVLELVKPEREKVNRKSLREKWWQYGEKRPALRRAIDGLAEVLVLVKHSSTVMPVRVPSDQVFSHALTVFATDSFQQQAVLSSSLHRIWAVVFGSTLETRVRYTASAIFETFPRPAPSDRLARAGKSLHEERHAIMVRRDLGLTKLYNLINNPEIAVGADADIDRMRDLQVEVDEAVINAYGWEGISLDHGFHTNRQLEWWTMCPSAWNEILGRLLEENRRRAAEESSKGTTDVRSKKLADGTEALFA